MTFAEAIPYVLIGPGIANSEMELTIMHGYLCYRTAPQYRWRPYCPTAEDIISENWYATMQQPITDLRDWHLSEINFDGVEIDCDQLDRAKRDSWAKAKDIVLD